MQLFNLGKCNKMHLTLNNGKVYVTTNKAKNLELAKQFAKSMEAEIRLQIYNEICDIDFTSDRKRVMKNGLENALLTVQDICANIALGKVDGTNK